MRERLLRREEVSGARIGDAHDVAIRQLDDAPAAAFPSGSSQSFGLRIRRINPVTFEHGFDGEHMLFRSATAVGMLVQDVHIVVGIAAGEETDGVMGIAIIQAGEPFDAQIFVEAVGDMDAWPESVEELTGGEIPGTIVPGALAPAGLASQDFHVFAVREFVVVDERANEPGFSFGVLIEGDDKGFIVPIVTDPAGIGRGIDTRPPIWFRGTAAGLDILPFTHGESGRLLDGDEVVLHAEKGVIDFVFVLVMLDDDARAVFENEDAGGGAVGVLEIGKEALTEVFKGFAVGFARFAQQQHFEPGIALAIVRPDLSEEPMTFTTTASAAEANEPGAIGTVAQPGSSGRGELPSLQNQTSMGEVFDLSEGDIRQREPP